MERATTVGNREDYNEEDDNEVVQSDTGEFSSADWKNNSLLFREVYRRAANWKDLEVTLTVNWMSGSYSDPWHPCKVRGDPWTEDIPKGSVICEVQLSRGYRLVEPMKKRLKRAYNKM